MESLKNPEFKAVYECKKSFADRYLVMYVKENDKSATRLGISVSKKVGNSVVRHRIKRLIRESARLHFDELKKGCDIVVIARSSAKGEGYKRIERSFLYLAKKHGIYAS